MKSKRFGITRMAFRRAERATRKPTKGEQEEEEVEGGGEEEEEEEGEGDGEVEEEAERKVEEEERQAAQEEQLTLVVQEEPFDSDGEECELHVYESRRDTRGEEVYLRAGTKSEYVPPKRRSHRACLVLIRYYSSPGHISFTQLEIQSRHSIGALREVIRTYPGVNFNSKYVPWTSPLDAFSIMKNKSESTPRRQTTMN